MNSSVYHISARRPVKTNAVYNNFASRITKLNHDVEIIKQNQLAKALLEIGKEFCRETSLHGMKHIVKKKYYRNMNFGIDDTILKYNLILILIKFLLILCNYINLSVKYIKKRLSKVLCGQSPAY